MNLAPPAATFALVSLVAAGGWATVGAVPAMRTSHANAPSQEEARASSPADSRPTSGPVDDRPIVIGRSLDIESRVLGETRTIRVGLPEHYGTSDADCCVLYLLDGNTLFTQAVGVVRHLGEFDAPPIIVIGIDNTERTRDLTPSATDADTLRRFPTGGGSASFRRFLVDELKPFVDARYRTNRIDLLAGHSFGGLFAAEALLEEPDAYDGFLLLSPSLWWDDAALVDRFESVPSDHELFSRFAWLAMGDEGAGMNPHFEAVAWALRERAPARFRWAREHFSDHDHWAAALPGLNGGLRAYFEPLRTFASRAESFEDIAAEFADVQAEFGPAVSMTAGPIVRRVRHLKEQGAYDAALAIVDGAAEAIPDEPLLAFVRAEVLAEADRLDDAIATLEAAIATFESEPRHADPVRWLRRQLEDVRARSEGR